MEHNGDSELVSDNENMEEDNEDFIALALVGRDDEQEEEHKQIQDVDGKTSIALNGAGETALFAPAQKVPNIIQSSCDNSKCFWQGCQQCCCAPSTHSHG